jgi:hypothetical protein
VPLLAGASVNNYQALASEIRASVEASLQESPPKEKPPFKDTAEQITELSRLMVLHGKLAEQWRDRALELVNAADDEHDKLKKALDNCFMQARRRRRCVASADDIRAWDNIIRFCEEAGCTSSILRDGP